MNHLDTIRHLLNLKSKQTIVVIPYEIKDVLDYILGKYNIKDDISTRSYFYSTMYRYIYIDKIDNVSILSNTIFLLETMYSITLDEIDVLYILNHTRYLRQISINCRASSIKSDGYQVWITPH